MVISQQAVATTYYVNPAGDDLNPGTSTQVAWRTIDKVNATNLNPGDSVLFESDHDYPGNLLLTAEDAGTPTQPVVIGSYGSERARITAGNGSGVTVRNAGGVEVKDLIVMGDDYKTNVGSGIKIVNELPDNQKLEYIRIHNIEASGFGREKNETILTVGPNGCGIFVGGNTSDKSKSGYKDVRITDCVTCQNEYYGILITGYYVDDPTTYANSHVYVSNCKMYDNPGDSEYFKNHSGSGILMLDVDGGIIEYCEAYNNGYDCFSKVGGPVGIWACTANNVIIQHCESHHNKTGTRADGGGFDFDGGTTNSIMQYNYSHDNEGPGYLICSYKNAPHRFDNNTIRYNVSMNDCQNGNYSAITFWTGSPEEDPIYNTRIYNNTIYSSKGAAISFWVKKGIHQTTVWSNIFITTSGRKLVSGSPDKSMATFAGNAYWAIDGKYNIAGNKSLDEWRKAIGQEMLNGKPVGMVVDPKLIDIGANVTVGDPTKLHTLNAYQLQKNSPLIDAGIDIRSEFGIDPGDRDFYGNPIPSGKGFDIGAHEFPLEGTTYKSKDQKAIEHIIQATLPESVGNCKYDGKGFMGSGVAWAYFEIPKTDLTLLLDKCDALPDSSELGQDADPKWNIEHPGEGLGWWKPSELNNRQYAGQEEGAQPVFGRRIDICVGEISKNLMGVYLVYHVD
jgi:hypothetical protein